MVTSKYVFHFKITRFTSKGLITYLLLPTFKASFYNKLVIHGYFESYSPGPGIFLIYYLLRYCVPTLHNNYCSKVDFEQYQYYSIFYKIIKKLSIPVSSMTLTTDWMSSLEKAEKTAILEDDVALKASNFPT